MSKLSAYTAITALADADVLMVSDESGGNYTTKKITAANALGSGVGLLSATAGTVTASKAVVVDSNKDIGDFRNLDVTNLDAGASGTAGTVDVFPATASRGKLSLACANQTGNTTVSVNANAMGQATTVNLPDPGAAASYLVQSTAALTLAEVDTLDAVVAGTVAASKAVVVDGSKNIGSFNNVVGVNFDAGASGTAGTVDVFPTTATSGKIAITCADNAANHTITLVNASHGQATIYTLPDIGQATGNVVTLKASQTTAGEIKRADLTEEALATYGIPVNGLMAADGAPLGVTETAGDHYINLGTNTLNLRGEAAISETEVSVSYLQFVLPPEYVAAGDVTVRVHCKIDGAGTDNGSTVDISAYEQADMAVGADLCATAAQTFAAKTTWYDKNFSITATGLVAGDVLNIKLSSSTIENAGSALAFYADPVKIMLDIKG